MKNNNKLKVLNYLMPQSMIDEIINNPNYFTDNNTQLSKDIVDKLIKRYGNCDEKNINNENN